LWAQGNADHRSIRRFRQRGTGALSSFTSSLL
jgi:hypothetical protein